MKVDACTSSLLKHHWQGHSFKKNQSTKDIYNYAATSIILHNTSQGFMICSSPLQVFKDLVPNCRGGEQFVNPRLVMVHLKGPIKYRYMLFRRGLDHKPFASKSTGTPQKNSEYSPLPLIPKLWSYKSTDAQMKLLLYCWRPCLAVTTTLFHFYFVFTRMHSHSTSFVHAQDMIC